MKWWICAVCWCGQTRACKGGDTQFCLSSPRWGGHGSHMTAGLKKDSKGQMIARRAKASAHRLLTNTFRTLNIDFYLGDGTVWPCVTVKFSFPDPIGLKLDLLFCLAQSYDSGFYWKDEYLMSGRRSEMMETSWRLKSLGLLLDLWLPCVTHDSTMLHSLPVPSLSQPHSALYPCLPPASTLPPPTRSHVYNYCQAFPIPTICFLVAH